MGRYSKYWQRLRVERLDWDFAKHGLTPCDLERTTCGSLDNVQNYMEYSYCSRMYTQGQRARMRAALNSSTADRNQLWTPQNLEDTGVFEEELLCKAEFSVDRLEVCIGEEVQFTDESFFRDR